MKRQSLGLYNIDIKYVRDLQRVDEHVMSVSPQIGKESRPFVGLVIICDNKQYCIPLSSPKPKHSQMKNTKDFSRIIDKNGKIIGVLNFNNMLPVHERLISKIDINIRNGDNKSDRAYKQLLKDQLYWCNDNIDTIVNKANKLYKIITETPDKMRDLTRRCCDFKKLERVLERWTEKGKMSDNGT